MKQTYIFEQGSEAHAFVTEREHEERLRREREELKRKRRARARKNAKLLRIKRRRFRISLVAGALLFVMFGAFVFLENGITSSIRNISSCEQQISDIKAENSALLSKINTDANLSNVKKKATKELGMKYAKSGQIVYYTMDEQDYMTVDNK
ncbi:MAG: hypothetical protein DUD27_05515 [Lachnospiraceae bacterium]|uniref:Cell division protein FtsL n=1 Tax=Candidatus Weimeria bifida TaxID=2599074 RepID=A0A6N7IYW1_9FIRM|nr:hypothetical protein [Candidatus Weimeria bifida]RRF96249.1 MAG: hypothetical protein DUD27_05515 [Lachnospiraceae bacterium]